MMSEGIKLETEEGIADTWNQEYEGEMAKGNMMVEALVELVELKRDDENYGGA
jgi:hypothetical protein